MKVTKTHVVETHHFARHISIAGAPVIKMRKLPNQFRPTHILVQWSASDPSTATITVRGREVIRKGKKYKVVKGKQVWCRRAFNNPTKLPKWLIEALLEGAALNGKAITLQREHKRTDKGVVAVQGKASPGGRTPRVKDSASVS